MGPDTVGAFFVSRG